MYFLCPYLVQTIHFFRGVNDSITSATQRIHVGGMLFKLVSKETADGAGCNCVLPSAHFEN